MPSASDQYSLTSPYGYTPTEWVTIVFIVLFSVSGALHLVQATIFKYWIVFPTIAVGIALEIIGWAGRYWSNQNILYNPPFLMQIITLIIAPVFFSAWDYTILGIAIQNLGRQYSMLAPKAYVALFVTCDVISLILQAVGGGWAASSDFPVPKAPTNIMVAGIIFQLASMIIFSLLACDFMYRAWRKKPYQRKVRQVVDEPIGETGSGATEGTEGSEGEKFDEVERSAVVRGWWWVMAGTAICSLMIIVRGVYRSVELVQGWNGYVISREVYQDCLDGIPMFIAVLSINVFHPGFFLPRRRKWGRA
ncbi:hypothetical protein C343_03436 [Cryptococcus neoformans C23]|uniref:Uncharacterized protein n=2 Tax=Cryptococcus neoformans TaxID=5207 RepID=A0A854QB59_CRYNE|nr:hypothetical protein CNAG_02493 [Cryptococcus neoformans var. grubii H99]AUB25135.1 hypothetical protein CKF44_02493 [Cryptococcus neoformans var. grubii]OWZ31411.1 hypothetical protein C347_03499 [Cryptococcus neoformans var. grubii AD2-60a]OWZ42541.1 hypothetical protein C353_03342 [Cryptococcus neoformans var. grubii AD1-83a]OWZ43572.1 hypothetical protein C343_03436 [Cryptococcus neoformans var. grubii C23]OXC84489.1 hypothetical protein C344_03196 [Cryptococcus neoformans var. grubii A|eukprot:XP_012050180.1 hypothetical protein CNAG_02493 [Cryptococcus neoformans var. grubii H99]